MAVPSAIVGTPGPPGAVNTPRSGICQGAKVGFTLIEVLVVVAILALLMAVLLPSLQQARQQARLVACQANSKQIATALAQYLSEEKDYVPVVFNYAASVLGAWNPPARACWVSVALRRYDQGTNRLRYKYNGRFDPEAVWDRATKDAYEAQAMPEQYACPFERGRGPGHETWRDEGFFRFYEKQGRFESFQTWLWENIVPQRLPAHGVTWPSGVGRAGDGLPRFASFSWNKVRVPQEMRTTFADGTPVPPIEGSLFPGGGPKDVSKSAYRRWTVGDVKRLRSGSMSTSAVAFCAAGEHILGDQPNQLIGRANVGSHRRSGSGGTNVVFADTHVEWVRGTQIGWP